jgi:hypothetical protein
MPVLVADYEERQGHPPSGPPTHWTGRPPTDAPTQAQGSASTVRSVRQLAEVGDPRVRHLHAASQLMHYGGDLVEIAPAARWYATTGRAQRREQGRTINDRRVNGPTRRRRLSQAARLPAEWCGDQGTGTCGPGRWPRWAGGRSSATAVRRAPVPSASVSQTAVTPW